MLYSGKKKRHNSTEKKKLNLGSSYCGPAEMNSTRNHGGVGSIPGLAQWVKDPMLLWLWCRLTAVTPIRPLAWELPDAKGAALKIQKTKKKKKKKERKKNLEILKLRADSQIPCF